MLYSLHIVNYFQVSMISFPIKSSKIKIISYNLRLCTKEKKQESSWFPKTSKLNTTADTDIVSSLITTMLVQQMFMLSFYSFYLKDSETEISDMLVHSLKCPP